MQTWLFIAMGLTPQEPLALVARLSDFERSALTSDGGSGLASATERIKTSPEIRHGLCIQHSLTFLFVNFFSILPDLHSGWRKSPFTSGDPFLGRIKAMSVPPPRIAKTVKRSITKVENIKGGEGTSLFLTPYSQSPMDDADMVIFRDGIGRGDANKDTQEIVWKAMYVIAAGGE